MGLGPGLHIRTAQTLVMSQQLQAAIKLLALSNIELEAVIAEEVAKNPLLEVRPGEGGAKARMSSPARIANSATRRSIPRVSDELMPGWAATRRSGSTWTGAKRRSTMTASPMSAAAAAATRRSTSTGWKQRSGLCEHLLAQLHGAGGTSAAGRSDRPRA